MGNLSTYYTATSLSDIADTFEERMNECSQAAIHARNMRLSAIHRAQADTWAEAVRILRTTTLVGSEANASLPTNKGK
jgi:hypothetical protein